MKAVVTGGAGFIGSHVAEALLAKGYEVRVVDDLSAGKREHVPAGATLHEADIRDLGALEPIFSGVDYVFHLAAIPMVQLSIDDPVATGDVNVNGTLNVLLAARAAGVKKVVFSSSASVYGDQDVMPLVETMSAAPKSPYALHKHVGEEYLALFSDIYGVPTVSLRYFNVYGPRASVTGSYPLVIAKFLDLRSQGKPLTVTGDGTQTRDYVHVSDVARANILAAESSAVGKGEIINIGSGKETSVNEIAALIGGSVEHIAPRLEPKASVADVRRAKELLGWEPKVALEEGIKALLA